MFPAPRLLVLGCALLNRIVARKDRAVLQTELTLETELIAAREAVVAGEVHALAAV